MEIMQQLFDILNPHACYILYGSILLLLVIGYKGAPFVFWVLGLLGLVVGLNLGPVVFVTVLGISLIFMIKPIRMILLSRGIMVVMKKILPKISDTERSALDAGVVWVEADLFSGKPDFKKVIANNKYPTLTAEEQAFIDGPVEKICSMVNDFEFWQKREMPAEAWQYLKTNKFLGMIIPKEYGGLGFSALAHAAVIEKLTSRSIPLAVTVMVPNSLGPAELLMHYGTDLQKKSLLPKLASGEEVPCFGLTEPSAGSDAGSILSHGILFKGPDGKLMVRLNWNKRWITLASISTTIGLAYQLKDPDNILGRGVNLGITCGLVPAKTPGVVVGNRHDPLGVPFYNCPTQGNNVEVSIDTIVGGEAGIGKGWDMLMDCLGAGRGISLPSQAVGGAKILTRAASAHAVVRKQFGLSIGKFEGIEEPLARIFSSTYLLEAVRNFTVGAIDSGIKPPVVTAIAKYHTTEIGRRITNDGMDVLGGAAISDGPRNILAHSYIATPIGITVEGANILTRTLMIFGQGVFRAHPYAYKEISAAEKGDVKAFDGAFWKHIGHVVRNKIRAILLSFTRGYIASRGPGGPAARCYQKLAWASASFAILTDLAMATQGGGLKTKEKLTGRFADVLSWMYMGTAILSRFEAEGRKKEDLPLVRFAMEVAFSEMQKGFDGILQNIQIPGLSWFFRGVLLPWSRFNTLGNYPSDELGHKVVAAFLKPSEFRDRHTKGVYIPTNAKVDHIARLDLAFVKTVEAAGVEKKIKKAIKAKVLPKKNIKASLDEAVAKNVITAAEKALLAEAEALRWDAIQVDDFTQDQYMTRSAKGELSGLAKNLS